MIPKMSELYVFANEATNFLQQLRPTLGLGARATLHQCLARVQDATLKAYMTPPAPQDAAPAPVPARSVAAAGGDDDRDTARYLPHWD